MKERDFFLYKIFRIFKLIDYILILQFLAEQTCFGEGNPAYPFLKLKAYQVS